MARTFPRTSNLSWNDITPKLGATYDVMGDGRTALKVTLNKYLIGLGTLGLFDNAITSGPSAGQPAAHDHEPDVD